MPVKRRLGKARNDYEAWRGTLACGTDWFGELPREFIDTFLHNGRGGDPDIEYSKGAWERHGARLLSETAATPGCVGNGSTWGLWAFGPPPNVHPETLAANLDQMRVDWNDIPDWTDREQAENWRRQHRTRLAAEAATTGAIPEWVAEHFPALAEFGAP